MITWTRFHTGDLRVSDPLSPTEFQWILFKLLDTVLSHGTLDQISHWQLGFGLLNHQLRLGESCLNYWTPIHLMIGRTRFHIDVYRSRTPYHQLRSSEYIFRYWTPIRLKVTSTSLYIGRPASWTPSQLDPEFTLTIGGLGLLKSVTGVQWYLSKLLDTDAIHDYLDLSSHWLLRFLNPAASARIQCI